MKRYIPLICALSLPGLAFGGPNHTARFDRNAQNMMMINEMQRQATVRDQEWRRRDSEQRRQDAEERQRELWRRDDERRRENARRQDERARDWEQRRSYEEQRRERFDYEQTQRGAQKARDDRSGSYRKPEYKGKPLNPKELRRYELIKPGDRP